MPDTKVTPEWMAAAACADPTLGSPRTRVRGFYPAWPAAHGKEPSPSVAAQWAWAKAICATCPVLNPCLDDAIASHEPDGVWGGMDPLERRIETRRRRRRLGVTA
mgnify:CR=1 FL=1